MYRGFYSISHSKINPYSTYHSNQNFYHFCPIPFSYSSLLEGHSKKYSQNHPTYPERCQNGGIWGDMLSSTTFHFPHIYQRCGIFTICATSSSSVITMQKSLISSEYHGTIWSHWQIYPPHRKCTFFLIIWKIILMRLDWHLSRCLMRLWSPVTSISIRGWLRVMLSPRTSPTWVIEIDCI